MALMVLINFDRFSSIQVVRGSAVIQILEEEILYFVKYNAVFLGL